MSRAGGPPPWWLCGLIGGLALALATLARMIAGLPRLLRGDVAWGEVASLPLATFAMGFLCGAVGALLYPWVRNLGLVGDALLGLVVMDVFFLACMALFAPELLTTNRQGGAAMLAFGSILGLGAGPFFARDWRRASGPDDHDQ